MEGEGGRRSERGMCVKVVRGQPANSGAGVLRGELAQIPGWVKGTWKKKKKSNLRTVY